VRLRLIAIAVWPVAILFTLFIDPVLDNSELKGLIGNHSSQSVVASVLSEPREVRGFNGVSQIQVEIKLENPKTIAGKVGFTSI